MSQRLAYFYTFAALREFQQERGADLLPEQRAQNMVLILKLKPRGPERENEFLQFTRTVLWSKQLCLVSVRMPALLLLCADWRALTHSRISTMLRAAQHQQCQAPWLGTGTAKEHLTNECSFQGTAPAVISKLLLSSGTSFAGTWVTSLVRLWGLFHHWAEE